MCPSLAHCDFLTWFHHVHTSFQEKVVLPKQGSKLSFWHREGDRLSDLNDFSVTQEISPFNYHSHLPSIKFPEKLLA